MSCDDEMTVQVTRGSIITVPCVWDDGAVPDDLTGYGVEVSETHAALAGRVTVAMVDASAGEALITIDAQAPLALGRLAWFRVRLVPLAGNLPLPDASPVFWLEVI